MFAQDFLREKVTARDRQGQQCQVDHAAFPTIQKVPCKFLNDRDTNLGEFAIEAGQARWQKIGCDRRDPFGVGIVLPAMCHQGRCLSCAGRLEGDGEVDQSDSVTYFPEDREAGFVLLCTGKPRSAVRIRTHQANEMRQFRGQKKLPAPYS
jgi:2Fe-2S iron-sulfur cluster protein